MSDTTLTILERHRDELIERERRLKAFGDELAVTTSARRDVEKTIAKLTGRPATPAAPAKPATAPLRRPGGNQTPGSSPRQVFTDKIVTALREYGPMSAFDIANRLDRQNDSFLQSVLTTAVLKGVLTEDDGIYAVPA